MNDDLGTAIVKPARTKICLWIDFVCPYCLLGEQLIWAAIYGRDVDGVWMPFELRLYPTPTLRPEDVYLPTAWKHGGCPASERLGVVTRL